MEERTEIGPEVESFLTLIGLGLKAGFGPDGTFPRGAALGAKGKV